jgi:transcriptional regulator with XRE-family HTH domain
MPSRENVYTRCGMSLIGPNPGEILRASRKALGLTQLDIAARADTSQGFVSRVENGAVSPTLETFARLLEAVGADLQLTPVPSATTQYEALLERWRLETDLTAVRLNRTEERYRQKE